MRTGHRLADIPGAHMPEAAWVIINTRMINDWLGTSYTLEEVSEYPDTLTDLITGIRGGFEPRPKDK